MKPGVTSAVEPAVRFAIEDLLNEFSLRADEGRAATIAELFVEDGRIVTPLFTLEGRVRIAAHFAKRDAGATVVSRHQWSNLRLVPLDNGDVRAHTIVHTQLGTRSASGPVTPDHSMVGDSIDVVRRAADGTWLFVERRLAIAFRWVPGPQVTPPAAAPGTRGAHG